MEPPLSEIPHPDLPTAPSAALPNGPPRGATVGYHGRLLAVLANQCAAVTGWRMVRLPLFGSRPDGVVAVAGWGRKTPLASRAAARSGLPFIAFEDGFLRSVRIGVEGDRPISLVVDFTGVHYDARSPSDLENLLQSSGWESPELRARAAAGLARLRRLRLSKYNHAPALDETGLGLPPRRADRPRVLVIDQTRGDRSITGGLARTATFGSMLTAAIDENPGAVILIKTHPAVIAGRRQGHFAAGTPGALVIRKPVNPWSLLERVDRVYTVSSLMGFEAVLAGLPVTCFGMPFYAGWGITTDRVTCPRRTRQRDVLDVFAAAYLLYARYVDPAGGGALSFERGLDTLAKMVAASGAAAWSPCLPADALHP